MTLENRAYVVLRLSDGSELATWEQFELRDSYTDPLGSYQLAVRPARADAKALYELVKKGSRVQLAINGHPQATLLVTSLERTYGQQGVVFSLECKTTLCTAYEASVDPEISKRFTSATSVSSVILEALGPFGFDVVIATAGAQVSALTGKAINGRGADVIVEELKIEDVDSQDGESAYAFASRLFGRLGVALRVRHDGALLVGRPDYEQAPAYTLVEGVSLPACDHILEPFSVRESNEGCVSSVVVRGGSDGHRGKQSAGPPYVRAVVKDAGEPASIPFSTVPAITVERTRASYSSAAAPFKPIYITDKLSTDKRSATHRARLIHGRRSENGFAIECEVDGLVSATGRIWSVDTVAHFASKTADIVGDFWVSEVSKRCTRGEGQRTQLKLIPLGSLVLGDVPG